MTRIGELLPILVASFESRNFAFKGKFQTQGKIFNPKSQNITKGRKLFFFGDVDRNDPRPKMSVEVRQVGD
jgi:hypothetical protein